MHKHLLFSWAFLASVFFLNSCKVNVLKGEGNSSTTTRNVSSFNSIDVNVPVKTIINVDPSATPGVQFKGYENVAKHIKTTVKGTTLLLESDLDETWEMDGEGVTAEITIPSLTALSMSGEPDADIHGNVAGSDFKLDLSGAGKVSIDNITVDNFLSDISGAGKIEVKGGHVKLASYEVSGAGKIVAYPLQTDETVTSISGAGKGEVSASQKLSVNISGAGKISYKGHPVISKDVSGAGSVTDAN
jgi:hypothetical protein